ncbi:MAG: DUF512 domain-containing protein [Clostridium sp.]|nr:DUF512 domain-containing protein [Clostridium sp.]
MKKEEQEQKEAQKQKKRQKGHVIKEVRPGSIAMELEIEAGDKLLSINDNEIEDIFDYQYQIENEYIELLVEKPDKEQWLLEVDKDEDEDLGIVFENGLMDDYKSCHNKCIFCFIDQMPKGMRDTLYFKDDDSRLSFLQGNYVTLTNMSEHDIDRIIKYRLAPINISFQTMNPELRCKMLNNRFAGEALKKARRLYEAGIAMNGQIVLCKGVNDGEELSFSIRKLMDYFPVLESVSVVPVGLSKFREGLYPLEPFDAEDAEKVLHMIHEFQKEIYAEHGAHFVHASDEWYLLAGREVPPAQRYDGYPQLENGVGMMRLFMDEFEEAYCKLEEERKERNSKEESSREEQGRKEKQCKKKEQSRKEEQEKGEKQDSKEGQEKKEKQDNEEQNRKERQCKKEEQVKNKEQAREISIATGKLAYPYLLKMSRRLMALVPGLTVHVYEIVNYFFGESITVAGLLTGQDIIAQLKDRPLGRRLLLSQHMLRSGEELFLDNMTVEEMEKTLQVKIVIVKSSGYDFINAVLE